jgi:D-alanyl-D-alanine-carboxypeptidase/D-alanyl-D-alanine-endopeptidase
MRVIGSIHPAPSSSLASRADGDRLRGLDAAQPRTQAQLRARAGDHHALMREMSRHALLVAGVVASLVIKPPVAQARQSRDAVVLPPDAAVRRLLADRVNGLAGPEDGVGIIVGVIGPQGRRLISYGHLGRGDPRPLDGNTVIEIGSVTKVFTALLLADMVRTGEVALADPVAKYLPAALRIPERHGRAITLLDLATHTSGLSFMAGALPGLEDSTAAKYSVIQLYDYLAHYELPRDIGAQWEYSNLGYWLLGQALASRAGMTYERLLHTRVIAPLRLANTSFTISRTLRARLAIGHNAMLQPAPSFSAVPGYALMSPAGGLLPTANDLLSFLSTAMGYESSPLEASMAMMLSTRRPAGQGEQALGWLLTGKDDNQLIIHDGGTFGYASSIAWDPRRRVGIVVLSNQVAGVGDIARHLLQPSLPLNEPRAARLTEIVLDPARVAKYAGRYEAHGEGEFVIALERDFLTIQPPADWGLPKLRLRSESQRDFFVAELPLRVTFQSDDDGRVTGALVYPPRGQQPVLARRIQPDR